MAGNTGNPAVSFERVWIVAATAHSLLPFSLPMYTSALEEEGEGTRSEEVIMPAKKLKEFLDASGVKYVTIRHSIAFTAQEIAASAHVSGKEMAKTVVVQIDGGLVMAVLPAADKVDVNRLRNAIGAGTARIASEEDFREAFPECELGAMPPFGNLYGMEVFVDERLAEDEEIAFNAGTHMELIRMPYRDFERLVHPKIMKLATGE
jgi:Ala-tRNA(Pro) deacylase